MQLDVTDDDSVAAAIAVIEDEQGRLDVLVNNAGIADIDTDVDHITGAGALREFDTNVVGIIRVTQAALPLLRRLGHSVIVNVSSGLGSFWAVTNPERHESQSPFVVYGASKAEVSMLTVQYAKALPDIKVNAVEPGYTATDLTGNAGGQGVDEGAEMIAQVASTGADGPTGTFQERGGELRW